MKTLLIRDSDSTIRYLHMKGQTPINLDSLPSQVELGHDKKFRITLLLICCFKAKFVAPTV